MHRRVLRSLQTPLTALRWQRRTLKTLETSRSPSPCICPSSPPTSAYASTRAKFSQTKIRTSKMRTTSCPTVKATIRNPSITAYMLPMTPIPAIWQRSASRRPSTKKQLLCANSFRTTRTTSGRFPRRWESPISAQSSTSTMRRLSPTCSKRSILSVPTSKFFCSPSTRSTSSTADWKRRQNNCSLRTTKICRRSSSDCSTCRSLISPTSRIPTAPARAKTA